MRHNKEQLVKRTGFHDLANRKGWIGKVTRADAWDFTVHWIKDASGRDISKLQRYSLLQQTTDSVELLTQMPSFKDDAAKTEDMFVWKNVNKLDSYLIGNMSKLLEYCETTKVPITSIEAYRLGKPVKFTYSVKIVDA